MTESPAVSAIHRAVAAERERLLALVRKKGRGRVDPEEVLHAALGRAIERADQIRDPSRAGAWLGRIVQNVLLDTLRQRQVPMLSIDALELAPIEDDDTVDCWCVLVQADQLKPEYAGLLRRVVVDGAAVTEAAAELGITANNAMVRLHRARKALRARLAEHCGTTTARSCRDCGCEARGCCPQPADR
ncbi:RNA polymerase sigma factor [Myxococcota bacterium]|nr:RNA polymerase sigma factor [Myxococcota bacterium]